DGDQRAAEGEPDEVMDRLARGVADAGGEDPVVARDAEEAEADHEQPSHRARTEGDVERLRETLSRSLRRAHVRAYGHVHPDEAGCRRQDGADQEADGRPPAERVVEAE